MKNILSQKWKVYVFAVLFWVVIFVVSALFIDPATGTPKMDLYLFHVLMFVISLVILYFLFSWLKKKGLVENATFITFLIVNILLDFALLIPFFGVTVSEWVTLILPSYILGTGIMYKLFK